MSKESGARERHFAIHVIVNGQAFWQSGAEGFSDGQHGIPPDKSAIVDEAAIVGTLIVLTNGPTMRPTTARIGSALRSHAPTFMN